jgi:DNA-binding Xre family transcriptional regulator
MSILQSENLIKSFQINVAFSGRLLDTGRVANTMLLKRQGVNADNLLIERAKAGTLARNMIKFAVREVAEREGVKNPKELADKTGLFYRTCYLLWHGKARRLDLDTLEKLCTFLGVRPSQLIEFEPDPSVLPKK